MSISLDGVISGMDTSGLIDAILANAAVPKATMEARVAAERVTLDRISGLSNRLQELSEAIESLQGGGLSRYQVSVPEGAGFTASVDGSVAPGSYSVEVLSLAVPEMEMTQGFTDPGDPVLRGTLTVTVAGVSTSLTIDNTNDTLAGLASTLDGVDGLSAYVVDTGAGDKPFRLVVQSEGGGTIEFDESGLQFPPGDPTPHLDKALLFTETQAGSGAVVRVNGIEMYGTSNQIEVVPGLTLNLNQAGLGPAQVEVTFDPDGVAEQMQTFIDAYNNVVSYYAANTAFDPAEGVDPMLVGEGVARRTLQSLGRMVSNDYITGGEFVILAQVGIKTEQDGTLSLDSDMLSDALTNNLVDVVALFTSETGPLSAIRTQIDDVFVDADSGTLKSRQDSLQSSIEDLEERIAAEELRLDAWSEILRSQFNAMEIAMAEMETTTMFLTSFFAPEEQ